MRAHLETHTIFLALAVVVVTVALAGCQRPRYPEMGSYIHNLVGRPSGTGKLIFSRGQIWRLGRNGRESVLERVDPGTGAAMTVLVGVEAFGRLGRSVCALHRSPSDPGAASVVCLDGQGGRRTTPTRYQSDDMPMDIIGHGDRLIILSNRSVRTYDPINRTWWTRRLSEPLPSVGRVSTAMLADGRTLYYGADIGEFGAGLWRVDALTGSIHPVRSVSSSTLCGKPADPQCDAVMSVAQDPTDSRCVVAAIANLAIFEGRLIRVCDSRVETMLQAGITTIDNGQRWNREEPFLSVVSDGRALWAATPWHLYRLEGGHVERTVLRPPETQAEQVTLAAPDLFAVWNTRNLDGVRAGYDGATLVSTH